MAIQDTAAQRRNLWLGIAVAAVVIAAIIILVVVANGAGRPDDASPRAASTSSASPAPTGGATGTSTPAGEPSTPPDASAPPAGAPGEPAPPPAQAPVALTEPAAPVPGVTFSIGALEAVDGVANGPGEVAGPALRFPVTVRNDTGEAISLTSTVVNLFAGEELSPAVEVGEPGGQPLPETVAAGASATGVFVFSVATELRDQVQISVDYSADAPVVLFEGQAPR